MVFRRAILALALSVASALQLNMMASAVNVGDKIPSKTLDFGFPPERINVADRVAGKKVILVGLPGAFTPT